MPDSTESVEVPDTTVETPVEILTPQDATAERIARGLSPEQAKAFKARRKEKKAKAATAAPTAAETPAQVETPAAETISFDEAETPAAAEPAEAVAEGLSEDELAKLDEKARKRITEASKEAAKVRKRAQEAEATAAKLQERLDEIEKQGVENAGRAASLAGNAFVHFNDPAAVAAWADNAQDALALLQYHQREVKAGRRDAEDSLTHTLPNGQEIELRSADVDLYQTRMRDAESWAGQQKSLAKARESATKLADKHATTTGYKEAREAYLKDASLPTRLEELVAKAALYDVLQNRRAVITFQDTAGAAKKAPSSTAEESRTAARKTPPSETPASTPRLAAVDDAGSDIKARKSLLMEKARTAKTDDERQKYLKQAIMLGPVKRAA